MLSFYRKAALYIAIAILASALICILAIKKTYLHAPLIPSSHSLFPWKLTTESDKYWGGKSDISINEVRFNIDYQFRLEPDANPITATTALYFLDAKGKPTLVNMSGYDSLQFSVKCTPENTLSFALFVPDERVTQLDDLRTYRFPLTHFKCGPEWSDIKIDLLHLETPQWWYDQYKLNLSEHNYDLKKVAKFAFSNTFQSPVDVDSRVQIGEMIATGHNWRYLYIGAFLLLITWAIFTYWFFKAHSKALIQDIKDKVQKDRPAVAYQALSLEPHKEKENSSVLRYMATEFSDPDLSLEKAVSRLGISRNKINDILKAELGYTFSTYLNKVRLTEAARLLAEQDSANVAEIAYRVGYSNVSYFNKLFKSEYGCTPKTFKDGCMENKTESDD